MIISPLTPQTNPEPTASQQFDHLKTETKVAAQDMKDYLFAHKAQFVEKMQSQLAEINWDLGLLSAKIEKSSDEARAEAKPKLQVLKDQAAELRKQLEEVKHAHESTWNEVKAGAQKTCDAMKDGFQQARRWASDKIAP